MWLKFGFILQSILLLWLSGAYLFSDDPAACTIATGQHTMSSPTVETEVVAKTAMMRPTTTASAAPAARPDTDAPAATQAGITSRVADTEHVPATERQQRPATAPPQATVLFAAEATDHAWAADFSQQLGLIFQQSAQLNHVKIQDIDCRTSLCRLQVQTEGAQSLALGIKIGAVLAGSGLAENAYQFAAATDAGVMTIYVGRTAQSFDIQ